ncbi:DNA dependent ATPase rad26 [Saccharomyces pastorianus]|uniref:DNA helicase n=1 Tax=Saccharomyces pastorianus TaxID=27292 RepID=A0A6C1DVE2_SACPS|nr:DNA dependent ATPase rad26 [Saccharomyces pastorianus]
MADKEQHTSVKLENNKSLRDLGVNVLSQSSLEEKIANDVTNFSNLQTLQQEETRLERSETALQRYVGKKNLLTRKLNNATRISVKQNLRNQIKDLQTDDIERVLRDIEDIQARINDLKVQINQGGENKTAKVGLQRPGESEKEFLIRTGKITAFGHKAGFSLDTTDTEYGDNEEQEGKDFEVATEQMVQNLTDEDDNLDDQDFRMSGEESEEYEEEENDDEVIEDLENLEFKNQPGEAKDDGDELYYQVRLKRWIKQRSADRPKTKAASEIPEWRKPHPNIPDAKLNNEFRIPGEIYSLLFNYQKTCVQWLYELYQQNCGGIIGDEMGLGKTIQIIAFIAALHHSGLLTGPVLIVCPATVMKQWCNELHHWWPPLRTVILHSMGSGMATNQKSKMDEKDLENLIMNSNPTEFSYDDWQNPSKTKKAIESNFHLDQLIDKVVTDGHILITTYVGLRIHSDKLLKVKWQYAVLDEGHKIRNPDSEISLTCKKLKTHNRIILSGTPIQNNLTELWSLFDFIFPGKLGTLPVFQQQFVIPINMGGYANATNIQVQTGYKCAVALRDLISPYLLRRVKADVAKDLPQKKEMVLFCKLTKFQRSKYLEFLHSSDLNQIQNGKRNVLFGIDILRKICNHPDILDRETKRHDPSYGDPKRSGKMQVVKQLLLLWHKQGYKALLFTQSRQMLDILEDFIAMKDPDLSELKYLRMDGTTNIKGRQSLVDRFNNEPFDVFLLTTRVGGLGINLTGANRIIIFDPDWNPSTDLQARERAWRIGQKREVSIYRLMVSGTIEEKIYHRQIFKQFLTNRILTDPKQKRFFKIHELQDLFSLGGENGHSTEELSEEVQKHTDNLKNSKSQESDDFEQLVNLSGVSKLESFYNGKEKKESNKSEDDRLIEGLLGGESNLETVMSHDSVVNSHANSSSSNMITREASRVATTAVNALRKSRKKITKQYEIGTPTWTGRFGKAGKIKKKGTLRNKSAGSAAILGNIAKSQKEASKEVRQENHDDDIDVVKSEEFDPNTKILKDIQTYLQNQNNFFSPSVSIIDNIGVDLADKKDVIKVRALLRTIAQFDKEHKGWVLNEEFRNSID